jgi:hypothetical protein
MRSTRTLALTIGALVAAFAGAACDDTGHTFGPPPPAVPGEPPQAVLEVTTLTARSRPLGNGNFAYDLKLILTETGGISGASFIPPIIIGPGGVEVGCSNLTIEIRPRDSWDMDDLGRCKPEPEGRVATPTLRAVVNYQDDEGRYGTVTRQVEVTE